MAPTKTQHVIRKSIRLLAHKHSLNKTIILDLAKCFELFTDNNNNVFKQKKLYSQVIAKRKPYICFAPKRHSCIWCRTTSLMELPQAVNSSSALQIKYSRTQELNLNNVFMKKKKCGSLNSECLISGAQNVSL